MQEADGPCFLLFGWEKGMSALELVQDRAGEQGTDLMKAHHHCCSPSLPSATGILSNLLLTLIIHNLSLLLVQSNSNLAKAKK